MRTLIPVCAAAIAAISVSACATSSPYDTAEMRCERERRNDSIAGALAGAAVGALAGSAIAGNSSNSEGAVIGGVAGAAVGSQIAKGGRCPPGYYAYGYDGARY